jgi:cephalosporin hydroxylase
MSDFVKKYSNEKDTDISSHLENMYTYTSNMKPSIIVECGVSAGESSGIFSIVNKELGSKVFGVDIGVGLSVYSTIHNGTFIHMDDCLYADTYKKEYGANIDVLFIDTSHLYDHTKKEIEKWFPLLSKKALVMFHDTNLDGSGYNRSNGTRGENWNNNRGVIRAIEEFFNSSFNEKTDFSGSCVVGNDKWVYKHNTICNGMFFAWKNQEVIE